MTLSKDSSNLFSRRLPADAEIITRSLNELLTGWEWRCTSARTPYRAVGTRADGKPIVIEWIPGKWLSLRISKQETARSLLRTLSEQIVGRPADLPSVDSLSGDRFYEWRLDGILRQWRDFPVPPNRNRWSHTGTA